MKLEVFRWRKQIFSEGLHCKHGNPDEQRHSADEPIPRRGTLESSCDSIENPDLVFQLKIPEGDLGILVRRDLDETER